MWKNSYEGFLDGKPYDNAEDPERVTMDAVGARQSFFSGLLPDMSFKVGVAVARTPNGSQALNGYREDHQ
jgi:hypothetical protein